MPFVSLGLVLAPSAHAADSDYQDSPGSNTAGAPIGEGDVVVDATRVLVLAPAEITAMGGAGHAFARGANGLVFQPAAPVNRRIDQTKPFGVSLAFTQHALPPGGLSDVANLGYDSDAAGGMANLGIAAFWRNFGAGLVYSGIEYKSDDATLSITEGHLAAGGSYADGQLVIGLGLRGLSMRADRAGKGVDYQGLGGEVGVMGTRLWGGWNLGASVRSPVRATPTNDDLSIGVDAAVVPLQVALGLGWTDAESGVARPIRVAADLTYDGAVPEGFALESAILGVAVERGNEATLSPHLGLEYEAIPRRLRLRAGTYLEPTRTVWGEDRIHATTGFEVRLFRLRLFKGFIDTEIAWEAAADYAPNYLNVAWLGIGAWDSGVIGGNWAEAAAP